MRTNRTNIKGVVAEFLPPQTKKARGVIIFCPGAPSMPGKYPLMEFCAKKGYWFFALRYRGTWESEGEFLKESPHLDVAQCMDGLKSFRSAWSGEEFVIKNVPIYLIGNSFGGPAVLLNSKDKRVTKVVAICSVADWRAKSDEGCDVFIKELQRGFPGAYRGKVSSLRNMFAGKLYNPLTMTDSIDGTKCILLHNTGDRICRVAPIKKLHAKIGGKLKLYKRKDHSSPLLSPKGFERLLKILEKW